MKSFVALSIFAVGASAAIGAGYLARQRRKRAQKNPAGIADANLSMDERREAAAEASKSWGQSQAEAW